jgi:hypothetical protein
MGLAECERFARVGDDAARDRDDYAAKVAFDRDRMIGARDFDWLRLRLDILFHSGHLWLWRRTGPAVARRVFMANPAPITGTSNSSTAFPFVVFASCIALIVIAFFLRPPPTGR